MQWCIPLSWPTISKHLNGWVFPIIPPKVILYLLIISYYLHGYRWGTLSSWRKPWLKPWQRHSYAMVPATCPCTDVWVCNYMDIYIYLYLHKPAQNINIYTPICLSIYLSIYLTIYISVYIYLSIYICLSISIYFLYFAYIFIYMGVPVCSYHGWLRASLLIQIPSTKS